MIFKYHPLRTIWKQFFHKAYIFNAGDIPDGAFGAEIISHASVASNGANATYGGAGVAAKWRAPQDCRILSVWWEPHGADSDANNTASYRNLLLYDGGADATGTASLASLSLTATLASDTQRAFTMAGTATVDQGDVVYASQLTVGGAHATGTVLVAGQYRFAYKPI